jgi:hypothetical protein
MQVPLNRLIFTGFCALAVSACGSSDDSSDAADGGDDATFDAGQIIEGGPTILDAADDGPCDPPSGYDAGPIRGGGADILPLSGYDYAPSVIAGAKGGYQAWWCGANPAGGDEIRYAEASSLDGPWHSHASTTPNTFDVALKAGGNGTAFFDTTDTCDPSVVQAPDGTYYMYYGGNGAPFTGAPNNTTQIGVASSPTGLPGTWTKLNSENPIVTPFQNLGAASYGAGQPSVVVVSHRFYMLYTDTTGANGPGIYVQRANVSDPMFTAPDVWNGSGFVPLSAATKTSFRISTQTGADWYFSDAADAYVMATDSTFSLIHASVLQAENFIPITSVDIPSGGNADGPGIVRTADGHAPVTLACGILPVDLLRADCYATATDTTDCDLNPYGTNNANVGFWDLAHVGIDLDIDEPCSCIRNDPTEWPNMSIDTPANGATIGASVPISGWIMNNLYVVGDPIDPASIAIGVDGALVGHATYGGSRPDVCALYPGRANCPNVGYSYTLDATLLAPGQHTITVAASTLAKLPVSGSKAIIVTR